jgi:hypothetical protein
MILLGYIILSHPDWKKSQIKIFITSVKEEYARMKKDLGARIAAGRLPITLANIEFVMIDEHQTFSEVVTEHSAHAGLTIIGFREDLLRHEPVNFFTGFNHTGDILFVNASHPKEIT